MTIKVVKVNTPPHLERPFDTSVEINVPVTIAFTNSATDDDIPANNLTFSLSGTVPAGATIDPATGAFSWSPPVNVLSTNFITVRVTDDGVPPLYDEQQFQVMVVPSNTPPVLTLSAASITEPFPVAARKRR